MISGTSIRTEVCRILGEDSQNSLFWKKNQPPERFVMSGRRVTKVQTTTRPDRVWPEVLIKIGKAAQNRAKQEWKKREPKTRLIRMTENTKKLSKHARSKLDRPQATAMPWKKETRTCNRKLAADLTASHNFPKTVYGCTVESHESTRQRVQPSLPKKNEDHIAGEGLTLMTHYNLVHKFIPMQLEKVKSKKEAIIEAQRDKQEVHFALSKQHMSPQERGVGNQKYRSTTAESCSVVTLSKTTLEPRARLRPKWLPKQ